MVCNNKDITCVTHESAQRKSSNMAMLNVIAITLTSKHNNLLSTGIEYEVPDDLTAFDSVKENTKQPNPTQQVRSMLAN